MARNPARRLAPALVVFIIACARSGPTPLSEADKTALRAADQQFAQGVMAKDWAAPAQRK